MYRPCQTAARMLIPVAICAFSGAVLPQHFPTKPIRLIVPQSIGSGGDLRARQVGQKLADAFGQPVVVDNRPGANGAIGARQAAKASPDGYTLFSCSINNALNDLLSPDPSCRLNHELLPVTRLTSGPLIMVVNLSVRVSTLKEFLDLARSKPKTLTYASTGKGSITQLLGEMIKSKSSVDIIEVPYKSTGAEVPDILGGHVTSAFDFFSVIGQHITSGRLKALAVANTTRLAVLPDVVTMAEAGLPDVVATAWNGICIPAGTPLPIVRNVHRELIAALNDPAIRQQIVSTGAEIGGEQPEKFAAFIRTEIAKWGKVVKDAGISLE